MRFFEFFICTNIVTIEHITVAAITVSAGTTSIGAYLKICEIYTSENTEVSPVESTVETSMLQSEFICWALDESSPAL